MNGLTRRWKLAEAHQPGGQGTLLDRLLAVRGVDPASVEAFLAPSMDQMHEPDLLPGAAAAADLLVEAIQNERSIAVYGDYDVDGITATAILWHVIKAAAPEATLQYYIPHRLEEGYGLNTDALRSLRGDGVDLVITVDCGITAVDEVAVAAEIGLDVIITDHHNPRADGTLPGAKSIVHPGLPGSTYPSPALCGAGVAFKLAWQFGKAWSGSDKVTAPIREALKNVMPLVAMGTIADVMPLTEENRILVRSGLSLLEHSELAGLKSLISACGLDGADMDSDSVGFRLAPCINAAGRMGHAVDAVELLTTAGEKRSDEIAKQLNSLNTRRRETEREILEQAIEMAKAEGMTRASHRAIVLAHPDWHPGVIGIVCSRLVDRFGRPTILMQCKDGVCRGSARSIPGYSVHGALTACQSHLTTYGGHDAAAGLELPADALPAFAEAFVAHANSHISEHDLVPWLLIDTDASLDEIEPNGVGDLEKMAPFGHGNRRPNVRLQGLRIEEAKPMGNKSRHLSLQLATQPSGRTVRAVWWNQGHLADRLPRGAEVDLVARPKLNQWRDRTSAELEILDLDDHRSGSPEERS
jgi:single-stranded-DNA-specific exonuclease